MPGRLVTWLVATVFILAAVPAGSVERLGAVGDWTLRADRHADGAPYCWVVADRAPGDRLTFLRSGVGLAVILTRSTWRLPGEALAVEVSIDAGWRDARRAAVGPRTLVLHWADAREIRTALRQGRTLAVTDGDGLVAVRWSLAGGDAALLAVERCWRERAAPPQSAS